MAVRTLPASRPATRLGIEFASPLPFYSSLDRLGEAGRALVDAARRFWKVLDDVECVWVLGPNPFAIVFALLALLRRRRVALGVRSEMVPHVRARHPGNRVLELAALAMDGGFKLLSRRCPVVAVGPEIGAQYSSKAEVLEVLISLVDASDVVEVPSERVGSETTVLSVGRLESEKNPHAVGGSAELVGYVSLDDGLRDLYASTDVLLHASWTEGFPQVLLEAFAAGLPVVATDVGGIAAAAGNAVRLIPPGDPQAAAAAVREITTDERLRKRLIEGGRAFVLEHTTDAETRSVAEFLAKA